MQTENRFLDDLARMAGGALNAVTGFKAELETMFRQQFDQFAASMKLVSREEFEVVQAMAAKAREEQEKLAERVARLEAALAQAAGPEEKPKAPRPARAKPKAP